jgi:hypothetical protein
LVSPTRGYIARTHKEEINPRGKGKRKKGFVSFTCSGRVRHNTTCHNTTIRSSVSPCPRMVLHNAVYLSSGEFGRMGSHRATLRRASMTSTNRRYMKRARFVSANFLSGRCINVKEVVWGQVETSDTRLPVIRRGRYLSPGLVRNARDGQPFAPTAILSATHPSSSPDNCIVKT